MKRPNRLDIENFLQENDSFKKNRKKLNVAHSMIMREIKKHNFDF